MPPRLWVKKTKNINAISCWLSAVYIHVMVSCYRAMHVVLAQYCYRKSSDRPSVRPSVRLSVGDDDVS